MRAYELYKHDIFQRNISDTRKPPITLRHLNHLNQIRKARAEAKRKKLPLISVIYGNPDTKAEHEAIEVEREQLQQEIELAKLQIEKDKLRIQKEIEEAELDNEQRQHIRTMAINAMKSKKRKN